jgi:hypothetical protein
MKRLLIILACAALATVVLVAANAQAQTAGATKIPPPEITGEIKVADLKPGLRVKLQLAYGKPMFGTVTLATVDSITLDLSGEASGLPGKFRFKKTDITGAWSVQPMTKEERDRVAAAQQASVAKLKIEVSERVAGLKSGKRAEDEKAKTDEQDLRKALDVVVSKDQEAKMRALLAEYPPPEWGEEKFRSLRERWVLYKLPPTPKESRFANIYQDWKDARDTIAVLDARDESKKGNQLLLKFPPSAGWGATRLAQIAAKEAAGTPLADDEIEFRKSYDDWAKAVARRAEELKQNPLPPETKTPEAPAQEKPAADKAPDEVKPDAPKPDAEKPAADAPAPAKDATPPATPAEEKP